jgi:chitin synthase
MSSALFNRAPVVDPPTWPVKDIVYVSIVGTVMLAALLEWILWLLAFLFCLAKVVQKAENWSVRILALANMVFFVAMRCIFLPIMVVTLPLPEQVMSVFPEEVVGILQWVCCSLDIVDLFALLIRGLTDSQQYVSSSRPL